MCSFFISMTKCRLSSSCSQKGLGLPCSWRYGGWGVRIAAGWALGASTLAYLPTCDPAGMVLAAGVLYAHGRFVHSVCQDLPFACVQETQTAHTPPRNGVSPLQLSQCPLCIHCWGSSEKLCANLPGTGHLPDTNMGPGQPDPVAGSPSLAGGWNWIGFKASSNPSHSMISWIFAPWVSFRGHQPCVSQHLDVLLVVPAQQRFLHPLHPVLERLQLGFQCGDGLLGSGGRSRRQLGFFLQQGHPDNTRAAWHTEDPKVVLLRLRISPWVPVRLPGTCGGTLPAAASPAHALFGALWGEHELSVTGTRTPAVASPRPTAPHELEGLRGALLCPGISPCRASSCSLLRASNFSFSSRSFPSSTWRCQTLNVP